MLILAFVFFEAIQLIHRSSIFQTCVQLCCFLFSLALFSGGLLAEDTFRPWQTEDVITNAKDLWGSYDARKEPLNVKIIREWKTDGVVTKYVTFTVGTFKGVESRIAAYYSYPTNGQKNAAFVWSHGGGQRAERNRGIYFAKQGFATVDINWLGRPLEDDITENTDWGKVDPSQGPRFYSKALRQGWKRNLAPDEFTIDPVVSPRNANWFLLAVAARRAITFLEQQTEVDPDRIGFSGFSMGGMITALTATDSRLKAVAPFVGGTGFKYVDFPGVEGSSLRVHFRNDLEMYKATLDPSAYWPHVQCPVMFISSTNDFHAAFDRIYRSMDLVPHENWRVTTNVHENHGPGPEQWVMLNQWFDQHLKGMDQKIPPTPPSTFDVEGNEALFRVYPEADPRLIETEIYYSYDPNARTRFWVRADPEKTPKGYRLRLPLHDEVPVYVFALCRYKLGETRVLERGETDTFALNSLEHSYMPSEVNLDRLGELVQSNLIFEDFQNGTIDWSSRDGRSLKTYKFQNPAIAKENSKRLALTVNSRGRKVMLRINASSKFLGRGKDLGDFSITKQISGDGPQVVFVDRTEFKGPDGKQLEWSKIASFSVAIIDLENRSAIDLNSQEVPRVLEKIELID